MNKATRTVSQTTKGNPRPALLINSWSS